jgi:uncharacterized protein (TIGR00730 family)
MSDEILSTVVTTTTIPKHHHLTPEDIKKGCVEISGGDEGNTRICRINEELHQGISDMELYENSVTFYGSARFNEGDTYYDKARALASRISKELGFTIITGGGPGIMEAGNRGAFEAGGKSVGLSITLPMEQADNGYTTDIIPFNYFFTRKLTLRFSSNVFVYFPGGFGTLDEFFEVITLIQTKKLAPLPVILYGTDFWEPVKELMQKHLLEKFHTIDAIDLELFTITDSEDEILDIIKSSKSRKGNYGE